jgi:MFS family permease
LAPHTFNLELKQNTLTQSSSNLSSKQPPDLKPLFWAGFCFWTSLASLLPTLPLYIRDIGGNGQQVGFVMGAFAIGLLGSRAWVGHLADERSRKVVLLLGMGVAAIAPVGYALFENIWILGAFRAFHGISIAAFGTAYSALVVDLSPSDRRGRVMGVMSLVQPLGVALGPAIGGLMQVQMGYIQLFVMSALLAMVGFVCTLGVYDPMAVESDGVKPEPNPIPPPLEQSVWQIVWSPRLRIPTIVMLLVGLAFGLIASYVPLYMGETVSNLNAGVFYTAAAIASFSLRMSVGKASDRLGRGVFITFGLVCYLLAMVVLWQAQSEFSFIGGGLLEGCGGGILIPMMATLMADRSQAFERGRVFSLCMGGFDMGIAIAGPAFGILATEGSYGQLFGVGGICVGVGLVLFLTCSSQSLRSSFAFALGRGQDVYALEDIGV